MAKILLEGDFGQIEARVIAMFSLDPYFTKALWERYDVHAEWAGRLARAYPDRIGGKKNLSDKSIMKTFRNDVKNQFVFPLFFGATLYKSANELSIPIDILKPEYDLFWSTFYKVKEWQESMEKGYRKNGYVSCLTGRRRRAPLSYNQIVNSPVQGTASDIVVDAMDRLSESDEWDYQPCLNVHDSLSFILDEDDEFDTKLEFIIKGMLNCRFPFITVPLTVEFSVGHNWSQMTEIGQYSSDEWLDWPKKPEWIT